MPRIKKKLLRNLQDKIIHVCSPNLIFFIQFVSPLPLICLNILLGLTFVCECGGGILFQVGFGREGRVFESGSWFFAVVCFLNGVLFGRWGWFYIDFLGDYILQRGLLLINFFLCFVVNLY